MERGYSDSFMVHAAIALEWSVDLVVEFKPSRLGEPRVEIWRLSPSRVRSFSEVRTDAGEHVGITSCGHIVLNAQTDFSDVWPRNVFEVINRTTTETAVYSVVTNSKDGRVERVTEGQSHNAYDLFISYKESDTAKLAEEIALALEPDFDIWFDKEALQAADYAVTLRNGIQHSASYLVLWSDGTRANAGQVDDETEVDIINQSWEVDEIVKYVKRNSQKEVFTYHISGPRPDDDYVDEHRQIFSSKKMTEVALVRVLRNHMKEVRRKKAEARKKAQDAAPTVPGQAT